MYAVGCLLDVEASKEREAVSAVVCKERHKIDCERFFYCEATYPLTSCRNLLYGAFNGCIDIQLLTFSSAIKKTRRKTVNYPCNTGASIVRKNY